MRLGLGLGLDEKRRPDRRPELLWRYSSRNSARQQLESLDLCASWLSRRAVARRRKYRQMLSPRQRAGAVRNVMAASRDLRADRPVLRRGQGLHERGARRGLVPEMEEAPAQIRGAPAESRRPRPRHDERPRARLHTRARGQRPLLEMPGVLARTRGRVLRS